MAQTPAPAYLVFSEVGYPGWRAWVDGVKAPIYQADLAFRAVYLPTAGQHTVNMRFDPSIWKFALSVSLATMLLLAVWGMAVTIRRWRR